MIPAISRGPFRVYSGDSPGMELEINMRAHTTMIQLAAMLLLAAIHAGCSSAATNQAAPLVRPPAVPLVTHDPYFSIWSPADRLSDGATVHWTGKPNPLTALVRIDGQTYRLMGDAPADKPALPQTSLEVFPTRTVYHFGDPRLRITLTFLTPALPDDIEVLSRPLSYITWSARSVDEKSHSVQIYFDAGGELAVNTPDQPVWWDQVIIPGMNAVRLGRGDRTILSRRGDDVRIDWGWLYLAAGNEGSPGMSIAASADSRASFASSGKPPASISGGDRAVKDGAPVLSTSWDLGAVSAAAVERRLMIAYDDLYSLQYFDARLRPYWRRKGWEAPDLLKAGAAQYAELERRCRAFDDELLWDLRAAGGENYAAIGTLAHRQSLAACKIVADANGQPLMFSKENFSNGCIGTVDVFYPQAPHLLLMNPRLMRATLVPMFDYAASHRWKFPYAPHDLGTYPFATGQIYGGGERTELRQMPVEESANMLLLAAAQTQADGNTWLADRYWPLLVKWAEYLKEKGFDPENQLCTDDFAGHLAHNVNLSAKAIVALGSFADLCGKRGLKRMSAEYRKIAEELAARWVKEADDGDHFRLAFDKESTWSQKYNLVWDRLFHMGLFPKSVYRKELDYYRKIQNPYGLPLDNRTTYAKLDWTTWTATLTGERSDFDALVAPLAEFLNKTPDRVPMTDWYWTDSGKMKGFRARSVVGGVYFALLHDASLRKKWAGRAAQGESNDWAALPMGRYAALAPTCEQGPVTWKHRFVVPLSKQWMAPGLDDSKWPQAPGAFGGGNIRSDVPVGSKWEKGEIWLRREFELKSIPAQPRLRVTVNQSATIYLNGVQAAVIDSPMRLYDYLEISPEAKAALKIGKNLIAVQAKGTPGVRFVDVGLYERQP